MKIYGFDTGGFKFRDGEAPAPGASEIAFLPTISVIPLVQHSGPPARAVVSVGDYVTEGMVMGRSDTRGCANVHAPIPGKVVNAARWRMGDGRESDVLVIKLEGSFEKLGRRRESFTWKGMSPFELQRAIAEKGVVELEGEGRPAAELLAGARNASEKSILVINAVFDDDWLAADRAVLAERAAAVAEGAAIAAKVSSAVSIVVAVSDNALALAPPLVEALASFGVKAETAGLSSRYPQRNARELELSLRAFRKSKGIAESPLLPLSPSTAAAVYDAVKLNQPLVERYVAIGGGAVKHPKVLRVRLGTRIGDAIAECGGFVEEPGRIVLGSPLTGQAVYDLDTPITKTTSAVVALASSRVGAFSAKACIGCGNCRSVCPVGLDPERLHKLSLAAKYETAFAEGAGRCHYCACCAVVCPSRLPLRGTIRMAAERGARG